MKCIQYVFTSLISAMRQAIVGIEQSRRKISAKACYTENQRRAVYRLQQFPTRIGD